MPSIGDIAKGQYISKAPGVKYQWLACVECGIERWVNFSSTHSPAPRCYRCGNKTPGCREKQSAARCHLGAGNPNWKGGRIKTTDGYILIRVLPEDFFYPMARTIGYVFEHRLVMAKYLGRNLHRWEIVHHKGIRCKGIKNRSDNLRDNLQLVSDLGHNQITTLEMRIAYLERENQALRKKLSQYVR